MPIHRTIKNVVKNYTPAEIKVREATSNDPWGPTTTLMNEIAELTYNSMALAEIMNMVWKRMSDQGKNWRHVFKSLNLLEYLAKVGSPQVAERCKSQIHALQGLNEFSYYEEGKDCGLCIREKSKQFVSLLKDSERFRNERAKALAAKERLAQSTGLGTSKMSHSSSDRYLSTSGRTTTQQPLNAEIEAARPSSYGEEDLQLQLALAMSKEEHEEELKRRKGDEFKLQLALEESKKINEEFQKTLQSFNQDLLDQNSPLRTPNKSNLPSSSTWDGNLTQPSSSMDPWGVPTPILSPPQQRVAHPPKAVDPWGDSFLPRDPEPHSVNDPWSPTVVQQSSATSSPWNPLLPMGGPPTQYEPQQTPSFNNGVSNAPQNNADILDSEFDLLSIRSTGKQPETILQPSMVSTNSKDYLGGLGEDLLSGTIWSQQTSQQQLEDNQSKKKMKSVEDFLGSNSNLVNLNDLITKPPPSTITNPFAMPSNPRPASAVPTNPMVVQSSFGVAWPMASQPPGFQANQIPPSYPQHNNPFL